MTRGMLVGIWLIVAVLLAGVAVTPYFFGPVTTTYTDAGMEVLQFVLALLSTTAGVGSMAVRESVLRALWHGDYSGSAPDALESLGRALLGAWLLCLVIGVLGAILGWASADPWRAWPYLLAAAALLLYHAPRPGLLGAVGKERI